MTVSSLATLPRPRERPFCFSGFVYMQSVPEKVRGSPTGADWTQKSSTLLFKAAIFTAT